jgi:hypothetical protein
LGYALLCVKHLAGCIQYSAAHSEETQPQLTMLKQSAEHKVYLQCWHDGQLQQLLLLQVLSQACQQRTSTIQHACKLTGASCCCRCCWHCCIC